MDLDERIFDMGLTCFPWECIEFDNKPEGEFQSITARYKIDDRQRVDYHDHVIDLGKLYAVKYDKVGWGMTHHADGTLSIRALVRDKTQEQLEQDKYDPDCLIE